jgi:hypothetical protein
MTSRNGRPSRVNSRAFGAARIHFRQVGATGLPDHSSANMAAMLWRLDRLMTSHARASPM